MAYTIKDNGVYRDGEKVAEFDQDGAVNMLTGCEAYRLPAGKAVRDFLDCNGGESAPEGQERPKTVRELVKAMQKFITEPCPEFSRFYGDKTPEVLAWIKEHEDVRKNVLGLKRNNTDETEAAR